MRPNLTTDPNNCWQLQKHAVILSLLTIPSRTPSLFTGCCFILCFINMSSWGQADIVITVIDKGIRAVFMSLKDLAANDTVILMVTLPQSYGWGRVQETGNTTWSCPAADGSVPLADEHLHEMETVPSSDADCSGQRQCHLNERKQRSLNQKRLENEQTSNPIYLKCIAHRTEIWLWRAGRPLGGDLAQSWR